MALLKKYVDVFAWTYDEMPGQDPGLVVHSLNIDPGVKPVVQLTRAFHTNVEAQITQEATSSWFYQTHLAPQVAFQHSTHEKKKKKKKRKEWPNLVLCVLSQFEQGMSKRRISPT